MAPGNPRLRYLYAAWAFLECLGFGGLIYGWGSLVYVLKDEGLYLDLCDTPDLAVSNSTLDNTTTQLAALPAYSIVSANTSIVIDTQTPETISVAQSYSCKARDDKLNLVFTIASAMFCVGCFVMGQVNFKFGTRITRIGALILFITGAVMIAFTSNEVPWLIFPGLSLVGSGGITYLMTNTQVSVLFPSGGGLVVGVLCGGFDASAGVQQMVKIGYENGVSRSTSYIIMAVSHLLTLVSTFFFLPKDFIKKPEVKQTSGDVAFDGDAAVELNTATDMGKKEEAPAASAPTQSLISCLTTPIYILHVLWLSMLQLRFYFFLGSFNSTMTKILKGDNDLVSHYTSVQSYLMMCGVFTSPFAGFVYDFVYRFFINSESSLRKKLMPASIPLAITTTLCLIMSLLVLVDDTSVLYLVFVVLVLFRSFMYTMGAGFIGALFPSEYFGILYGILILFGGIISFFQNALFKWADASGSNEVNLFLLFLTLVTYGHPLFLWFTARRAERSGSMGEPKQGRLMDPTV